METNHSFAILAYKKSPYLQDCIDSLKNQTIKSQIIVCTSTPNNFLRNITAKNELPLFINPERNGMARDWNFAFHKCNTTFITLAHQDDIYYPNYTEEILKAASRRDDILIVFSNNNEIIHKNGFFQQRETINLLIKKIMLYFCFKNKNYITKNKKKLLIFGNPICCPTVTFHKINIGELEFNPEFSINVDWKAWHDLAQKKGGFLWVKKILVSHRIHNESTTSRGLLEKRQHQEDAKMFKFFWPSLVAKLLSKIYNLCYINKN